MGAGKFKGRTNDGPGTVIVENSIRPATSELAEETVCQFSLSIRPPAVSCHSHSDQVTTVGGMPNPGLWPTPGPLRPFFTAASPLGMHLLQYRCYFKSFSECSRELPISGEPVNYLGFAVIMAITVGLQTLYLTWCCRELRPPTTVVPGQTTLCATEFHSGDVFTGVTSPVFF